MLKKILKKNMKICDVSAIIWDDREIFNKNDPHYVDMRESIRRKVILVDNSKTYVGLIKVNDKFLIVTLDRCNKNFNKNYLLDSLWRFIFANQEDSYTYQLFGAKEKFNEPDNGFGWNNYDVIKAQLHKIDMSNLSEIDFKIHFGCEHAQDNIYHVYMIKKNNT